MHCKRTHGIQSPPHLILQVLATISYFVGDFPPGKHDAYLAVEVIKNQLVAHAKIYHLFKQLPHGDKSVIGLAKNTVIFDPFNQYNPIENFFVYALERLWTEIFIEFMATGRIENPFPLFSMMNMT